MSTSYLIIAIECALDAMGVPEALTSAQVAALASSLETSLENESMATGRDCIPHPLETRLCEQSRDHKSEVARIEKREDEIVAELRRTISSLRNRIYELEREHY